MELQRSCQHCHKSEFIAREDYFAPYAYSLMIVEEGDNKLVHLLASPQIKML